MILVMADILDLFTELWSLEVSWKDPEAKCEY